MDGIIDKAVKLALEGKANIGSIVVIEPMDYDFEKFQVAGRTLTLYTIEDFTMLSNQGIFRS